jgi:iron complex transport system substrate-binding protein
MQRIHLLRFLAGATALLVLAPACRPKNGPAPTATDGSRLVSLAPNLTEIVCAVGGADRLVGRTDVCNYPSGIVSQVPVVAAFGRPYLEPLLAQKPTLVLETALEDKAMGVTLDRLGIGHRHVPCRRLAEIPGAIRSIGRLAGRVDAGETLATAIEQGIRIRQDAVSGLSPAQRPLVFVELWGDPLMTAGKSSFISELVALAGGRNLGDELTQDYATVSTEWVIERNPEVILCLYAGANHQARRNVAARLGWQNLAAVQHGRVYDELNLDTVLRPGPRVLEGVEQLRRVLGKGTGSPPPAGATGRMAAPAGSPASTR